MNNKKTILHLVGSDFLGSPEHLIVGQLKNIPDYNFITASFNRVNSKNDFLDFVQSEGFRTISIRENHLFDFQIPFRIKRLIDENDIKLIVSHGYKANFYSYLLRQLINIPQCSYFHGWTSENKKIKFYNFLDKMILPRLDKVIAVSESSGNLLKSKGVKGEKIEVVYNAIDVDPELELPDRPENSTIKIAVIGRLSYEKGIHVLLESLKVIKDFSKPFEVDIYGKGVELDNLLRMVDDYNLNAIVNFKGYESNTEKVYKTIDFIVIPSLSEGHPLVILEAWKYGVGIVATRAGGIPEIIIDRESGLLVDINDPHNLAKAIKEAIENLDDINKYGRKGFRLLKEKYNYIVQAKRLSDIYASLIS